jgi:hypothetical protein
MIAIELVPRPTKDARPDLHRGTKPRVHLRLDPFTRNMHPRFEVLLHVQLNPSMEKLIKMMVVRALLLQKCWSMLSVVMKMDY